MIDIESIRLEAPLPKKKKETRKQPKPNHFLKGPIPLNWLARAALLPGRGLHAAIVLHHLGALERSDRVIASKKFFELFGMDRSAKNRALNDLERAGLISVERGTGKAHRVTILTLSD